jgi:hypothetical protein
MMDRVKVFGKCMATANREFLSIVQSVPEVLVCVFYKLKPAHMS